MVSTQSLLAFAGLAFVLVVIPGPSVLFTIGRAITVGRRVALLTVLGNAVGVYLQVVAVAVGLGAVVLASATIFTAIKLIGAAYLVWLGVQAVRHRHDIATALSPATDSARPGAWPALRDGFVVGVANPKTIVFLAALLPQFADPARGSIALQMMLLGVCIPVFGVLLDSVWALAAGAARDWFGRSPRRLAAVGGTGGLAMIGLGASLALTGRKD
ncbi:lysine transporter LysE [Nocardia neocaledoniensis NBRC 108232]|uniref:Threonine/homoserine/homoserine lactone efflux protein n=1 Tax=Nocardia neocaledoniensis TaxID=236511 RepID=A0A317NJA2_9NOCA|nr:LysE family translocator [Nocardia neocaledoniensis]PWV75210.1 threonine/homoserine/homoserine lactone efflux protein [Nocardia neocaledoniensis]GEM31730.1 lysine transporter LysE [Nocardia neocaledoniensis NBRC 108232]